MGVYKTYRWHLSDVSLFAPHLRIVDKYESEGGFWLDTRNNLWGYGPTFNRWVKKGDDYE